MAANAQNYADVEKDHAGHDSVNGNRGYDLHHDHHDTDTALKRMRTAGSLTITPELFEKIYLSPKNQVSNNIRSTFGNPTPLALVGFLLSLTPLSNVLMGWRGSGGLGAAEVGAYYFFGGLLMVLGGFLEFILGNTFPFVVFGSFGAFWLTFGATLTPYYNAAIAYQPLEPETATSAPQFNATFAFFQIYMGVLCFVYMIVALRTNLIFVMIFALLVPSFGCLAAVFFYAAQGVVATTLQTTAGALTFIVCLLGWYLFFVQLLASVDFPLNLPVGDLSGYIKGASERAKGE
jgi:succinate-acetate transporter protein